MKDGIKIIDFRCRPPVPAYKTLFELHLERRGWENKLVCRPENAVSPSMHKAGEEAGLDLLMKEIDDAGIDLVVAPGRVTPPGLEFKAVGEGELSFSVPDETLVSPRKRFNNRLLGLTALELSRPVCPQARTSPCSWAPARSPSRSFRRGLWSISDSRWQP